MEKATGSNPVWSTKRNIVGIKNKERFCGEPPRMNQPPPPPRRVSSPTKEKHPFLFQKKFHPPPKEICKECFFSFGGYWRVRQCVGLSPSVRGSFKPPRTRSARHHLFWKLVRDTGIEPVSQPWEGRILPLNQSRVLKYLESSLESIPKTKLSVIVIFIGTGA